MARSGNAPRRTAVWLVALLVLAALAVLFARVGLPLLRQDALKGERTVVKLVRVSDGDTAVFRSSRNGEEVKVRLIGIDAPELGTGNGFRAALATSLLCEAGIIVELEPERGKEGKVRHDKYGRVLGWVWVTPNDSWRTQREWLARLHRSGERSGPPSRDEMHGRNFLDALRRNGLTETPPNAQTLPARLLLQEELLQLGAAELYPEAKGSKHYARLEKAAGKGAARPSRDRADGQR